MLIQFWRTTIFAMKILKMYIKLSVTLVVMMTLITIVKKRRL